MDGPESNGLRLKRQSSLRLGTIGDDAHEFGIRAKLAIHFGLAAHALNTWAETERCNFQHQAVTGNHRTTEARLCCEAKAS